MQVIAITDGYDGVQFRSAEARTSDGKPVVFELDDAQAKFSLARAKSADRPTWFVPVDADGNPTAPVRRQAPRKGRASIPGQGPERGAGQFAATADSQLGARLDVPGAGPAKPTGEPPLA